ncbi:MAG TPA: NlpC/P60 family protein [Spirochaetota bacterium]|nr:NlpC/P60 family protein [Spirochaetota bacterium]
MHIKKYIILLFILISFPIFSQNQTSREEIVTKLFTTIEEWLGTPYLYAGLSKNGVDCSGFAKVIYKTVFNIDLPNGVSNQKKLGRFVDINELQSGDLLFFNTTGEISHVGIYLFDKKFAHAASAGPNIGVIKSSLDEKYYKERFVFARRIIDLPSDDKENENTLVIEKDYSKTEIKIGKVLYRDKIYEESDSFKENSKIFIKIEPYDENLNLIIENEQNLNFKLEDSFLIAKQGVYTIKITDKNNNLIKETKISVEEINK